MRKIKAVIFDLGNTLLFFSGSWDDVYERSDLAHWRPPLLFQALIWIKQLFAKTFRSRLKAAHKQRELGSPRGIYNKCIKRISGTIWVYKPCSRDHRSCTRVLICSLTRTMAR